MRVRFWKVNSSHDIVPGGQFEGTLPGGMPEKGKGVLFLETLGQGLWIQTTAIVDLKRVEDTANLYEFTTLNSTYRFVVL